MEDEEDPSVMEEVDEMQLKEEGAALKKTEDRKMEHLDLFHSAIVPGGQVC